jgi:hypothetical protein
MPGAGCASSQSSSPGSAPDTDTARSGYVAGWPTAAGTRVPLAGYASRRLSTQNVMASRMAASITKMPVSMPWNAQNLLAGW